MLSKVSHAKKMDFIVNILAYENAVVIYGIG